MSLEIKHSSLNWKALYRENAICGPAQIWIRDRQILSFSHCQYDDMEDRDMTLDKKRFFRKSGARVHFASGHFANGNTITQTARYAGNACRMTTDIKWCAGNTLKESFQVGSFVLPGKWQRLLTVPSMKWQTLPESGSIELPPDTPAIVFETENGIRLEAGLGDDLWRWENGLSPEQNQGKLTIEIQNTKIIVNRAISIANHEIPLTPVPRFYRFESYFAWYAPEFEQARTISEHRQNIDLPQDCWEGRSVQHDFRTIIRQAAEQHDGSTALHFSAGMTPSFCDDGRHFNRKENARHWDLCAILDAASWANQTMKTDFSAYQPEGWDLLPSLAGIGLPNGFSNDDIINDL